MKSLKNNEKVASGPKEGSLIVSMRSLREMAEKEAKRIQFALKEKNLIDPQHVLELTKSIHGTGERSITEYINRNTEILLNEHSSIVREQVIENMKKQMQDMRNELTLSTQKLEKNFSSFFELIDSSYKTASQSFKKVVMLAQENYEKEGILHKTKDELFTLQRQVQQLKEELLECLMCYAFLETLFPSDQLSTELKEFLRSFGPSFNAEDSIIIQQKMLEAVVPGDNFSSVQFPAVSTADILKVIDRLKGSNLSLLLSSTALEVKEETKEAMQKELQLLDAKIGFVQKEIVVASELKEQLGDEEEADVELGFESEKKKLTELYILCTGSKAQNIDTYLMKSAIDDCLQDLFYELNKYPSKKTKEMLKVLETEKKLNERRIEEALRAERLEKRLQKAGKLRK